MSDGVVGGGVSGQRLRCCICGQGTEDAQDYVLLEVSAESSAARQYLGAHAGHLNSVLAKGFSVEVHLM
ncbi:hypothetical protein [Kitasatospora sp. GAS1066B]|uniref:hypothetical protein n=1 Tax=Kitasatospora sp. GAS1066B TaxID=3156271 RepID=UPI003516C00A